MHTEEEAKTKWCPFAREVYVPPESHCPGTVANRDYDSAPYGCRCIASECMAWRWSHFTAGHAKHGSDYISDGCPPGKKAEGYCGLAGRPE